MFHIFDRPAMKERAKANLKRSYWPAFLVSLIIALITGGVSIGPSFSFNLGNPGTTNEYYYETPIFENPARTGLITVAVIFSVILMIIFLVALAMQLCRTIFAGHVLQVGAGRYYLNHARAQEKVNDLAYPFSKSGKVGYFNVVKVMFLRAFKLFLWELPIVLACVLLVAVIATEFLNSGDSMAATSIGMILAMIVLLLVSIPLSIVRCVKSYQYAMIPYLLAEYPEMPAREAFAASKELTDGYKWELFVVDLSFIGWELLGALCLGIGTLFVAPYVAATQAQVYITLCNLSQQKKTLAAAPVWNGTTVAPQVEIPEAAPAEPAAPVAPASETVDSAELPDEPTDTQPEDQAAPDTTGEE